MSHFLERLTYLSRKRERHIMGQRCEISINYPFMAARRRSRCRSRTLRSGKDCYCAEHS